MNSSVRICILLIVLFYTPVQADENSSLSISILSMPVAESEEVIKTWLARSGFLSIQDHRRMNRVIVEAWHGGKPWRIELSAHTPLATRMRITTADETAPRQIVALRTYLDDYINNEAPTTADIRTDVPKVVRDHLAAVVCIYAVGKGSPIQLSGFCIDSKGLILSTAHNLVIGQAVRVQFLDGQSVNGRVVKLDAKRDLCLVRVPSHLPEVIAFRNGRYAPEMDEWLYAMGCPRGESATVRIGTLDGPPRRVDGFPLWQARIEIAPGSSGSPVLDEQGRLTAIIKGRYRGTSDIGFLIPFETLLHFMGKY